MPAAFFPFKKHRHAMSSRLPAFLLVLLPLLLILPAQGQTVRIVEDDDWCRSTNEDRGYRHCEVREITLSADRDRIDVDAEINGGIAVYGQDRDDILVRAKVTTHARDRSRAEEIAEEVSIETSRTIRPDGPRLRGERNTWYAVSFEIYAPHDSNLELVTHNGGIAIEDIRGDVGFEALNGGVSLAGLAGDVQGSTTNGGIKIELVGDTWEGAGLDVETVNGGVVIEVPETYSAELESGTVNGGIDIEFPVRVQGRLGRTLNATLGDGGRLIRARTVNGGVVIKRS